MHYVFITGGVASSLGKGIASAALATLLKSRRFKVRIRKLDPYLNVDPGTMSPYQHGEVFVTDDGAETDLDLGHYERFTDRSAKKTDSTSSGRIYSNVLKKERKGDYLGATIQVIPHVTDEIKLFINSGIEDEDIIIYEIGGTVGDIESLPYIESVRQVIWDLGKENALVIHLTLIPFLAATGELKTKPTQHSVKTLMESGISADIIVCRTEHKLTEEIKDKLALFCNVKKEAVIQSIDVETIYDVPLKMSEEGLNRVVLEKLNLRAKQELNLNNWNSFLKKFKNPKYNIKIGLVGKYVELQDSYKSILESLIHAGAENETEIDVISIHSEHLDKSNVEELLNCLNGLIVAPGFGERGIEGKITAITYARENKIPFFGICLGMQMAVIEYARNKVGLVEANSTEMVPNCKVPVIDLMESQKKIIKKGGTMRLGSWDCDLNENTISANAYAVNSISERHRHRYEFNNGYFEKVFDQDFIVAGTNPETGLVEIIEYKNHPWFVGVQFHPEYKSTVSTPHPLFKAFVKASLGNK